MAWTTWSGLGWWNNAGSVGNRLGRFAAAAERLGPVTIESRDALEIIAAYDVDGGVIYCDPPYLGSTRTAIAGGRRPKGDYPHEFAAPEQHEALAEAVMRCRAAVLVS